jgi:hypothetical protein
MSHLPNHEEYGPPKSGSDIQKDVAQVHDGIYGTYKDDVEGVPADQRLPTVQMPKGPDKMPFVTK